MKQWVTAVCANRKLYVVACIVLAIAISTAIVWHCSHRLRIVKSTKRKVAEDVRMELQHVKELKIRKRGETIWELSIEVVKVNKARTRVQIKGLKRGIYYQNGKPLLEISAQHALWDMVTDDIEVWGGVTARTPSGLVIRTNKVMWRDSDAVLECPQRVIGESEKLRFVALRVSYLPHKNLLRLCNGVYARSANAQFYCRELDVYLERDEYIAKPPVRLTVHISSPWDAYETIPVSLEAWARWIDVRAVNADGGGSERTNNQQSATVKKTTENADRKPNKGASKQKRKSKRKEKTEHKLFLESPTQPLRRIGRRVYGAEVTVREEGEEYTIYVKKFVYDEDKEHLVAEELVRFEDPEVLLTAPRAELFRRERLIVLHGRVHMESRPKGEEGREQAQQPSSSSTESSSEKALKGRKGVQSKAKAELEKVTEQQAEANAGRGTVKQPVEKGKSSETEEEKLPLRERIKRKRTVVECDRVEYFYRERRAVATGNLEFQHGQYAGTADMVTYWRREDKLVAEGNVIVRDTEEGHIFECSKATILLANDERPEDEIIVEPGSRAILRIKEEEEEEPKEKSPPKGGAPEAEEQPTEGAKPEGMQSEVNQ